MKRMNKKHFTLIELLVVMALGIMLIAIGLPAFNQMITGGTVTNSASTLKGGLEQAQSQAVTQRRQVALLLDCEGTNNGGTPAIRTCYVKPTGNDKSFTFTNYTPGSKWVSLGKGAVIAGAQFNSVAKPSTNSPAKLDIYQIDGVPTPEGSTTKVTYYGIVFNTYGVLAPPAEVIEILLAEGIMSGENVVYSNLDPDNPSKPANSITLEINPFTGKIKIKLVGDGE